MAIAQVASPISAEGWRVWVQCSHCAYVWQCDVPVPAWQLFVERRSRKCPSCGTNDHLREPERVPDRRCPCGNKLSRLNPNRECFACIERDRQAMLDDIRRRVEEEAAEAEREEHARRFHDGLLDLVMPDAPAPAITDLVDSQEIAGRMGVDRRTVRAWAREEGFPLRVGDRFPYQWSWAEVHAWVIVNGRLSPDDPDVVDTKEIARRLGVTPGLVRRWLRGHLYDDFPAPLVVGKAGKPHTYRWSDVEAWAKAHGRAVVA